MAKLASEQLQSGNAALRRGDSEAAADAFLRVLAVAPDNAEAGNALRDIERRRVVRSQTDRVARLRPEDYGVPAARAALPRVAPATGAPAAEAPRADVNRAYDFDQSMELFRAGDVRSGLNGFRRYVDANPGDRTGRQEIGAAVYERARTLDAQGQGDQALALYDQAKALAGGAGPWDAQAAALRRRLAADQYEQGMRLYRTDLDGAIRHLQASVTYDPSSALAQAKLQEAKLLQDKLKRLDGGGARR
jgi:tetratricopeptide (TPR) repeat protein